MAFFTFLLQSVSRAALAQGAATPWESRSAGLRRRGIWPLLLLCLTLLAARPAVAQTTVLTITDFGLKTTSTSDQAFTIAATSNSPAPFTYTVTPTSATTVSVNSSGVVTIKANTTGNFVVTVSQAVSGTFTAASAYQGLLVAAATPASVPINALAGVPGANAASFGSVLPANGSRGTYSPLFAPAAIATDGIGNVYFTTTTTGNIGRIYKAAATTGLISLVAGDGTLTNTVTASTPVTATATGLAAPRGLAVNTAGTVLYVSERNGRRISRIDLTSGTSNLSLYAGNGTTAPTGTAPAQVTMGPHGLALAADGTLYVADNANSIIRRINAAGTTITTVAGLNGMSASVDGALGTNRLHGPQGLALAANGDLYIADNTGNQVRVLSATSGDISTFLTPFNSTTNTAGTSSPNSLVFDYNGNLYVGETNRVRKYSPTGAVLGSTYVGNNTAFNATSNAAPANGTVTSSGAVTPLGLAIYANKLYVASGSTFTVQYVTDNNYLQLQTISFSDFGVKTTASPSFTLAASTSAGLTVSYTSSDPTIATISGNTLTLNGVAGNAYITASQAGDALRQAAPDVVQTLLVGQTPPASLPITALAGAPGIRLASVVPITGSRATYSPLYTPHAVAADTLGNSYFVNYNASGQGRVYKISAAGVLSLLAGDGTTTYTGSAGTPVAATATGLLQPRGLAVDRAGTVLYVSELTGRRVSKIDLTTGNLTLYAGTGTATPVATLATGAVTPTAYALPGPWGLALRNDGSLYILENADHTVRMINPAGTAMSIVAGTSGSVGAAGDGGAATAATISAPRNGLVVKSNGDFFLADYGSNVVRQVIGGTISTLITGLSNPNSLAQDYNGNFYVGELYRVRKYSAAGTVINSTFIGNNGDFNAGTNAAPANGAQAASRAVLPTGLFVFTNKLYIASAGTYAVQVVTDDNLQTANPFAFVFDDAGVKTTASAPFTLTSTIPSAATSAGLTVSYALTSFNGPTAPATVSSAGLVTPGAAGNAVLTATLSSNAYRPISATQGLLIGQAAPASVPVTTVAGVAGVPQATANAFATENFRATYSQLHTPYGVTVDGYGNTYFTDYDSGLRGKVYKVTPAGVLTTVAGNGSTTYAGGGQATASGLNQPRGLVVNNAGTVLYVAEFAGHRVSRIDLTTGVITLYAGNGTTTSTGSTPTTTAVPNPLGLALSVTDDLYVASASSTASASNSSTVLLLPAGGASISVVAGIGGSTGAVDGALGINTLNGPRGLVLAANGDLYIADTGNSLVRKLTASTGELSTFITAFNSSTNTAGVLNPNSLALDFAGNLFVGEAFRVRKYNSSGALVTSTYAGNNGIFNASTNPAAANGNSQAARAIAPTGLTVRDNQLFIASAGTGAVQTITDAAIVDPLPVELTAFTAERRAEAALLRWNTASEKNCRGFEVQVSTTGKEFSAVGWVNGAGSSAQRHAYEFTHEDLTKLAARTVYYRLRQVDEDGTASFSPVRVLSFSHSAIQPFTIAPNPAHGAVRVTGLPAGQLVQLTDALGRAVYSAPASADGMLELTLPTRLAPGLYHMQAGRQSQRLVLE